MPVFRFGSPHLAAGEVVAEPQEQNEKVQLWSAHAQSEAPQLRFYLINSKSAIFLHRWSRAAAGMFFSGF